jgi:hypothetical protein
VTHTVFFPKAVVEPGPEEKVRFLKWLERLGGSDLKDLIISGQLPVEVIGRASECGVDHKSATRPGYRSKPGEKIEDNYRYAELRRNWAVKHIKDQLKPPAGIMFVGKVEGVPETARPGCQPEDQVAIVSIDEKKIYALQYAASPKPPARW